MVVGLLQYMWFEVFCNVCVGDKRSLWYEERKKVLCARKNF